LSHSIAMRNDTPPAAASEIAIWESCPGYELIFPQGQSPYYIIYLIPIRNTHNQVTAVDDAA
jgi:hypothetical protein